jgi:D-tyrosyl-tRNA(Tyr) deacylase
MKIVLQRVKEANVKVESKIIGKINRGIVILVGIEKGDGEDGAKYLANKIVNLRIFPDKEGKMNLSLLDVGGEILAVSQFTLAASIKKGRRPSFEKAEEPHKAEKLFNFFINELKNKKVKVETGIFGAMMEVFLINDGPVTYILKYPK